MCFLFIKFISFTNLAVMLSTLEIANSKTFQKPLPLSLVKEQLNLPTQDTESSYSYKTLYFDQQVDHFGFNNDDSFKQKYLIADQYWKEDGPIFLYTGNEGDIELFCNNTGFMWDIATKFNALLLFAEHRYYGDSLPYGKDSYANASTLNYLTSEQALADFAVLVRHLKLTIPGAANSSVVAFGGSYGGMLAAWMRMKYPNIVTGALAASAPVWQFSSVTPCPAFYDTVSHTWYTASKACGDNLHNSYKTLRQTAQHDQGYEFITYTFGLCDPLEDKYDIDPFMQMLVDMFTVLAEVNYPYPADFLAHLPAWPVQTACKFLSEPMQGKDLLIALAKVTNIYFNGTGTAKCVDWKKGGSTPSLGYQGWAYQACTEMVMPMCSNFSGIVYNIPWDFNEYSTECVNNHQVRPRRDWITTEYWGKQLQAASNIIFSNGLYDPWSSGGVLESISDSVVSILIPRGAHHLDLRASNPLDTPEVIKARKQEIGIIATWLGIEE